MKTKPHPATHKLDTVRPLAPLIPSAGNRIPGRWRWHYRVLQSLRGPLLEQVRASLTSEVDGLRDKDPDGSAREEPDRILALCLLSGEQDALHEVDSAIRRILSGSYGICERSGRRIPMQRLRAIPWTRYTREAQEALESQRGFFGHDGVRAAP